MAATIVLACGCIYGQSLPAASRDVELSVFAGGSGNFTGLNNGKNLDATAGMDVTFLRYRDFRPAVEVRGTYPVYQGQVGGQKSFLIGPKLGYSISRLHPYVDLFVGRGAIDYSNGGYIVGNLQYQVSNSFVYSTGLGVDYTLGRGLAAKTDFQFQHWNTPVLIASGSIHSKVVTLGIVYAFDFALRHHQ